MTFFDPWADLNLLYTMYLVSIALRPLARLKHEKFSGIISVPILKSTN